MKAWQEEAVRAKQSAVVTEKRAILAIRLCLTSKNYVLFSWSLESGTFHVNVKDWMLKVDSNRSICLFLCEVSSECSEQRERERTVRTIMLCGVFGHCHLSSEY